MEAGPTISSNPSLRFRTFICLIAVLIAAAVPRLIRLGEKPFTLDEAWAIEIATGRGSLHQHLPFDHLIIPPPPFYSLSDAPAFWQIWTHMQVTHPPLYSILLRWWQDALGDTDHHARMFSVAASLLSIILLFDIVRLQQGLAPATWSSLLLAFAGPQIEYARSARSYTLLIVAGLLAVNMVVRIHRSGSSRRRFLILLLAILSTLMIHYFCVGALLGLFAYCLWKPFRRSIVPAFAAAGLIFIVIWGPFMWQQRHLFATDDPSTLFLSSEQAHHFWFTCLRIAIAPIELLSVIPSFLAIPAAIAGTCVYVVGFLPRRNHDAMLWGFWLIGTVAVIAFLDLTRQTNHLFFIRYIILAGPAVYAIVPGLLTRWPKVMHVMCGMIVLACGMNVPALLRPSSDNAHQILFPTPGPQDLLIIAAPIEHQHACEDELLCISRYLPQPSCQVEFLTHPADADLIARAHQSRFIFLITETPDYQHYLPGATLLAAHAYQRFGNVWTLTMKSN